MKNAKLMREWAEKVVRANSQDGPPYFNPDTLVVARHILDTVPEPVDPIQAALDAWYDDLRMGPPLSRHEQMRAAIDAYEKAKAEAE